jgi:FkbM family methyltransferase
VLKPYWWRWLRWHISKKRTATPAKHAEWQFEYLARRLKPGEIAIDCGANVGVYTSILARTGATVYAFEPDPAAFEALSKKLAAAKNVNLLNQAVGAFDGTVQLFRHTNFADDPLTNSQSSSTLPFKGNVDPSHGIEIRQIRLSSFVRALGRRIAIMKVDIEGGEFSLLRDLADEGCLQSIDAVFVETHEHKIPELQPEANEVRQLLRDRSYDNVNLDWR